MARMIDGDVVTERLRSLLESPHGENVYNSGYDDAIWHVLDVIEHMPTLTPPNEPRVINADKLAKRIAGHSNYHGDSILAAIYCAAEGKENDAPIRPIETPPNEPLTLDELREMDGEPVYVVPENEYSELGGWCVISADDSDDYSCALVPGTDYWRWRFEAYGEQWLAYRRPPEGDV